MKFIFCKFSIPTKAYLAQDCSRVISLNQVPIPILFATKKLERMTLNYIIIMRHALCWKYDSSRIMTIFTSQSACLENDAKFPQCIIDLYYTSTRIRVRPVWRKVFILTIFWMRRTYKVINTLLLCLHQIIEPDEIPFAYFNTLFPSLL